MARYINGLSSLSQHGNYIMSEITGEIVAEVVTGLGRPHIRFDEYALKDYGAELLRAALKKGGF